MYEEDKVMKKTVKITIEIDQEELNLILNGLAKMTQARYGNYEHNEKVHKLLEVLSK